MKVKGATLDVPGKASLWNKKNVTANACAKKCLSDENCLSFEITKKSKRCYISKETAASSKEIKASKSRDYYQLVDRNYSLFLFSSFSEICNSLFMS